MPKSKRESRADCLESISSVPENSVAVFEKATGLQLRTISQPIMNTPRGVAVDANGSIYIVDCVNHRILKFDCNYYLILNKQHDVKLDYPFGICIVDKHVYVADRDNHRVQVFTLDLQHVSVFQEYVGNTQILYNPVGIAFDNKEEIFYVADEGNNSVNKFNIKYRHIGTITSIKKGKEHLRLGKMRGIAVSSRRKVVFVTEPKKDRILCFDTKEEFVCTCTEWDNRRFRSPQVIALDPDENYLYVGDDSGVLRKIELHVLFGSLA